VVLHDAGGGENNLPYSLIRIRVRNEVIGKAFARNSREGTIDFNYNPHHGHSMQEGEEVQSGRPPEEHLLKARVIIN